MKKKTQNRKRKTKKKFSTSQPAAVLELARHEHQRRTLWQDLAEKGWRDPCFAICSLSVDWEYNKMQRRRILGASVH